VALWGTRVSPVDGQSALNLAAARLRHIAGTAWSTKRYLNMELLKDQQIIGAIIA
jgi:putative transposase